MKKIKGSKIHITFFLVVFCLLFAFMPVAGCSNDEEKKYDVAIRVACSNVNIYEFPVGEDEKHITIPYDGTKRTFKVKEYRLEGCYSDRWVDILQQTDARFDMNCLQIVEGHVNQELDSIVEPGNYCIRIRTGPAIMSLTDYTEWSLYIKIK